MVRIAQGLGELLSHPPIVMMTGALLAGYADYFIPFPVLLPDGLRSVSIVFFATGIYLCLAAFKELWIKKTTVVPHGIPSALAYTGVFRLSRNPIYLGYLLGLLGIAVYLGSVESIIGASYFFFIVDRWIIPMEEKHLHTALGAPYDHYRKEIRRWI